MLDYSDRRQVNSNRPKKQGTALYIAASVLAGAVVGYFLGLGSGWMIYKPARQEMNKLRRELEDASAKIKEAATVQAKQEQVPATGVKPPESPLTFYNNLPSGKVLGTGVNLPKDQAPPPIPVPAVPQKPASPQNQPTKPSAVPTSAAGPASVKQPAASSQDDGHPVKVTTQPPQKMDKPVETTAPKPQAGGKYVVQIASYQVKSEADAVRKRLVDNGFPAYVVESSLGDKGTWYRVRVGKHLDPAAAAELAGKAGKGAIIILE